MPTSGDVNGAFTFHGFSYDEASGACAFRYSLAGDVEASFEERISFVPAPGDGVVDRARLDRVLTLLGAILGISYYKASAPGLYVVEGASLTEASLSFLRDAISLGLAEYAFRNDFDGLVAPAIVVEGGVADDAAPAELAASRIRRPLVPVGGGKDSAVSVTLLGAAGFEVTQIAVKPNSIIRRVAERAGRPLLSVGRTIAPALLELNASGALNGHVPVTAMNSLICVAQSLISGLGPVVMSNESSASEATVDWNGVPVNHQWSKSLEAELGLARAIRSETGYADLYFSLLRPFSELRIAQIFTRETMFDDVIVSCNRAYTMSAAEPTWCGHCDKCRFVFLAFASAMSPDRLLAIFGANLFDDESQIERFDDLLGLGEQKPFECVGEIRESQVAASVALQDPRWRASAFGTRLLSIAPWIDDFALAHEAEVLAAAAVPALEYTEYEEVRRAA